MAESLWAIAVGLVVATSSPSTPYSPLAWSPSGREIAWSASADDESNLTADNWVLPRLGRLPPDRPARSEIWVCRVADGACWRVASSQGVFCAPCWSADGESLFVVRWERGPTGASGGLVQLERHSRGGGRVVLLKEEAANAPNSKEAFSSTAGSASQNGLVLAMPWTPHPAVVVYSLDDGRLERRLEDVEWPAWRADGEYLAAFSKTGGAPGVQVFRRRSAAPGGAASLAPVTRFATPFQTQPVSWDRSGESFLFLRTRVEPRTPHDQPEAEVLRASLREGTTQRVAVKQLGEVRAREPICQFAVDDRRESIQMLTQNSDDVRAFTRKELDPGASHETIWHPLDVGDDRGQIGLGAPAFSPKGDWLAFRYGEAEWGAPLALWNTSREQVVTVAPNRSAQLRALRALVGGAKRLLHQAPVESSASLRRSFREGGRNRAVDDPYIVFPEAASRAPPDASRRAALDRIASHGLELIRLADAGPGAPAEFRRRVAESAMLFHWVRGEFAATLDSSSGLEAEDDGGEASEFRLTLAVLRLDCRAALGARHSVFAEASRLHRLRESQLARQSLDAPAKGERKGAPPGGQLVDPHLRRLRRLLELPPLGEDERSLRESN